MNVAMIYAIAALLAIVIGAPVALLAPLFLPALVSLPAEEAAYGAPMTLEASQTVDTAAPFVAVYAARPARNSLRETCAALPLPRTVDKVGKPLQGAAKRAATARASRAACVSHACPTVVR